MDRAFRLQVICTTLLFCLVSSSAAIAETPDRTHFGNAIRVSAGEETGELTCFGCSIYVRGHVMGDVTAFGGSVVLEDQGEIDGDTTVFAGGLRLAKEAKVGGDVAVFGGRIRRETGSSIGGEVSNFAGPVWLLLIFVLPFLVLGLFIFLVVWLIRRLMRPAVPAAVHP